MSDNRFIKVPTNLSLCCDLNCKSVLETLIQLSSVYADKDGWFFRSNGDMEAQTKLSMKVINGALDALLREGVIDFIPQQQGQGVKQLSRHYKVNDKTFKKYEEIPLDECYKNPEYQIKTSDYNHGAFTWQGKEWAGKPASSSLTLPEPRPEISTNIDNIENEEIF